MTITEETTELLHGRSAFRCEIRAPGCRGDATDRHHRQRRGQGDDTITNLLHGCRWCHRYAHNHPRLARDCGWIVSAWADPATVPVRIRGRWVKLTCEGGKDPTEPPTEAP